MKRAMFLLTMFTGIPTFAADSQDKKEATQEPAYFPENTQQGGLLNALWSAPSAIARRVDTYNNLETQKKMFGLDEHSNCEEHKKTKSCAEYFRQIANDIPPKVAVDQEMQRRLEKRRHIHATLSIKILMEQKQNEIGDLKSSYTITRCERLLECCDVFGSSNIECMLKKYKETIQNNLASFVPEKKLTNSNPTNTDNKTDTAQTTQPEQPSKPEDKKS